MKIEYRSWTIRSRNIKVTDPKRRDISSIPYPQNTNFTMQVSPLVRVRVKFLPSRQGRELSSFQSSGTNTVWATEQRCISDPSKWESIGTSKLCGCIASWDILSRVCWALLKMIIIHDWLLDDSVFVLCYYTTQFWNSLYPLKCKSSCTISQVLKGMYTLLEICVSCSFHHNNIKSHEKRKCFR